LAWLAGIRRGGPAAGLHPLRAKHSQVESQAQGFRIESGSTCPVKIKWIKISPDRVQQQVRHLGLCWLWCWTWVF
jgi:hypothetical protein